MWRAEVVLTCGPPLANGLVIGHGLSFKVAVFGDWASPGSEADVGEPVAMAFDPSADRVVAEEEAEGVEGDGRSVLTS
jgi:hypothetical protein